MRKIVLLFLCCCIWGTVSSEHLPERQVRKAAMNFLKESGPLKAVPSLQLARASRYSYLYRTPQRFVLMAADDALPQVLGYGQVKGKDIPPTLQEWLEVYDKTFIRSRILSVPKRKVKPVPALLSSIRHQGKPFNDDCPYYRFSEDSVSKEHCLVGCVATSLEQIMTYYQRNYVLLDTLKGFATPHYVLPDVLPGASVDSREILPVYDPSALPKACTAVARLSYWMGLAVKMDWGLNESGAIVKNAVEPLKKVFGWQYVHHLSSYHYTPEVWLEIMQREIEAHRPVLFAGAVFWNKGHAFVLDGLDSEGNFHVNWGYGGNYDGFFNLAVLNFAEPLQDDDAESAEMGYVYDQEALLMAPDAVSASLPDSLKRTGDEMQILRCKRLDIPVTGQFTRYDILWKNVSKEQLTTTFAAVTSLPADTNNMNLMRGVGMTKVQLAPRDTTTVRLYVTYQQVGERLLRLTPDGEHWWTIDKTQVDWQPRPDLDFSSPLISYPSPGMAKVELTVKNTSAFSREGNFLVYELIQVSPRPIRYPGAPEEGTRHMHLLFLSPGGAQTDVTYFKGLTPGMTYLLKIRNRWPVVYEKEFTLPFATGIHGVQATTASGNRYDLWGRQSDTFQRGDVYIQQHRKYIKE